MENPIESTETHQNPEVVQISPAELAELRKKAEASEQNFARLKKAEQAKQELEAKLSEGNPSIFDPSKLQKEIDEKVDLRMRGYTPDQILEIERYARGAGIGLPEAEKSPFVQSAVEALRAKAKSVETTPAPSAKIKTFNGKPVDEIFREGSAAEKQAAFEAKLKGVKSNE